jgi:hypothetical protein
VNPQLLELDTSADVLPFEDDLKFAFHFGSTFSKKMFHFWINTRYLELIPPGKGESHPYILLTKDNLDKACKDKKNKAYPATFAVRLTFTASATTALKLAQQKLFKSQERASIFAPNRGLERKVGSAVSSPKSAAVSQVSSPLTLAQPCEDAPLSPPSEEPLPPPAEEPLPPPAEEPNTPPPPEDENDLPPPENENDLPPPENEVTFCPTCWSVWNLGCSSIPQADDCWISNCLAQIF